MVMPQGMPPSMAPPQMSVQVNPQGMMQQGMSMEMQQGAMMTGGGASNMPPNMPQMGGMMYPFMPPYGPPAGSGMMGPRFSMHPMMYGQYPYPAVHPYMEYYQQGFVPGENSQLQYDNYYTSLNPFAEPWKPGMGPGPNHDRRAQFSVKQGAEKCSMCSEKDQEEKRKRYLCDKHKHEKDCVHNEEYNYKQSSSDKTNVKFPDLGKSYREDGQHNQNEYNSGSSDNKKYVSDLAKSKKCSVNKGYSYENELSNSDEEVPEWSTNDDFEDEEYDENATEAFSLKLQEETQSQTGDKQYDRKDYQQSKEQHKESVKMISSSSTALSTAKTPPIPVMMEPNAKLYRQSLNNLREKRNSLIQQLQEINKEATAHEHKLEELSESLPNLFRFDHVDFKEFDSATLKEATVYASTLKHPEPLDTGPFSLKKIAPSNGEIFERLGAISGVPPRSVNDSIIASWTAATLKYSECQNNTVETSQAEALASQAPSSESNSKTTYKSTANSSSNWSNVDQDFPYWKDVTQNLDSPLTTPPSTPCPASVNNSYPASVSNSYCSLKAMSEKASGSYDPISHRAKNIASSHRAESVNGTYTSTYGQPDSNKTSTSSDTRYYGTRSSVQVNSSVNAGMPINHSRGYEGSTVVSAASLPSSVRSSQMLATVSSYTVSPSQMATASHTSRSQPMKYSTSYEPPAKACGPTTSYWPTTPSNQGSTMSMSSSTSYRSSSQIYGSSSAATFYTSSDMQSQPSFSRFMNLNEEDDIPFIEGSPIISKYGPISRGIKTAQQTAIQAENAADDDATKTVPVTAVTPLKGPPLPSAQRVPSRFTQQDDAEQKMNKKSSSPLTAYEKSYSLWTTQLNLLEQKAKKASTEDEKLSVKLQAVQMQIALKEQELQQAQVTETTMCSEYMKNRH
ncbi:uncharacterized protein LOC132753668 [Ruditapes philippinarum]|uniref:uncharacterized protein LOC132753668 n=1 Tax=Ruditapes philippinarum TaxID=129788 RepID=UPI00295A88A9|nr:uncharacterized protein LOC132753668 [Ruditapes philippinarum]